MNFCNPKGLINLKEYDKGLREVTDLLNTSLDLKRVFDPKRDSFGRRSNNQAKMDKELAKLRIQVPT